MFKSSRVSPWVAFIFSLFMSFTTAQAMGSPHAANDPTGMSGLVGAPGMGQ